VYTNILYFLFTITINKEHTWSCTCACYNFILNMLNTINKVIGHEKVSGTTIIHCIHDDIILVFVNTQLCARFLKTWPKIAFVTKFKNNGTYYNSMCIMLLDWTTLCIYGISIFNFNVS
jgi:hypothetical protein